MASGCWLSSRLRSVVRRLGAVCADQPGPGPARFHNRTGEDACPERSDKNADAHLKRIASRSEMRVMGREVVVAVTNGRLDFGTWGRIFYGEFDGRRRKRVLVKIIGE